MRVTGITSCSGNTLRQSRKASFGRFADEKAKETAEKILDDQGRIHKIDRLEQTDLVVIRTEDSSLVGEIDREVAAKYAPKYIKSFEEFWATPKRLANLEVNFNLSAVSTGLEDIDESIYNDEHPGTFRDRLNKPSSIEHPTQEEMTQAYVDNLAQ